MLEDENAEDDCLNEIEEDDVSVEDYYKDVSCKSTRLQEALRLLIEATRVTSTEECEADDILRAITLYRASLAVHPTAEGYTYLGWMYSMQSSEPDMLKSAIKLCKKAIAYDPTFGNPFNDIGSYLTTIGEEDQALEWFERAKRAARSTNRPAPFINLGRYYLKKGQVKRALIEFYGALQRDNNNMFVIFQIRKLEDLIGHSEARQIRHQLPQLIEIDRPVR